MARKTRLERSVERSTQMQPSSVDHHDWQGPLSGLRVIDLTRVLAGPLATQFLGDLGAEILKIEPPGGGDETRKIPPFVNGESHYFLGLNRSKKSLVVDLRKPAGAEILRGLAARADVLVENYRPGVMDRLGLGYEALSAVNPRLIYCAISGFGLTGPLRDLPAFDIVTQALTGVLSVNGERGRPPVKLGLPMGDMVGGIFGPIAILSALHERSRTGRGRLLDVSLYDGLLGMLGYLPQLAFVSGRDPEPVGSSHPTVVPYGSFPASDGAIIIAALSDRFWLKVCEALDLPQFASDPRLAKAAGRREHRDEIERAMTAITATRSVAEWQARLSAHDVPHAPVLGVTAALSQPHAIAREMVQWVEHPVAGRIRVIGRSIKFPGAQQEPLRPPPTLGQHTVEVLKRELGYTDEAVDQLVKDSVIA